MRDMPTKSGGSRRLLAETRQQWPLMSLYERFEQVVAIALGLVIAVVVALALAQLLIGVVPLLLSGALFGMVMTLLIALEFKHSIIRVALRRSNIVQVKTVVLIALIALSRKFVILDSKPRARAPSPRWQVPRSSSGSCTGSCASATID